MAMQDGLAAQQMEVLLDMHSRKMLNEIRQLREELSATREELRKEIQSSARSAPQAAPAHYQGQFAAQAPPAHMAAPQGWGQPAAQQGWPQAPPPQQWQQQAAPPQQAPRGYPQPSEKAPVSHPIDRNGVAPSEVSIDKFFNFSGGGNGRK